MNEPGARLYEIRVFGKVTKFVDGLTHTDRAKVIANIKIMEMGGFDSVYIKTLKGAVKELVVKNHRFVFFVHEHIVYIISAFIKKTQKTPPREISNAEKIYKIIIKKIKYEKENHKKN